MNLCLNYKHWGALRYCCLTMVLPAVCLFVGCEEKKKVLEIQTPGGGIEINRSTTTNPLESGTGKPSSKTKIEVKTNSANDK